MEERRFNLNAQEDGGFDTVYSTVDQAKVLPVVQDPYDLPVSLANLVAMLGGTYASAADTPGVPMTAASRLLDAMRAAEEVTSALPLAAIDRQAVGELIVSCAEQYGDCGVPVDDLIQQGFLGLLEKVHTFDVHSKRQLMGASRAMLRVYMRRSVKEQILNIPIGLYDDFLYVQASRTHVREDGSDTTFGQACYDFKQNRHTMEAVQLAATVISLDMPAAYDDDGKEVPFADIVPEPAPDPLEVMVTKERYAVLRNAVETYLRPQEQAVIALRYGLINDASYASSAVAEKLGLSEQEVRRIEERAIRRLRHYPYQGQFDVFE